MQLTDFCATNTLENLSEILLREFDFNINTARLTPKVFANLKESVDRKLSAFRRSPEFHTSEQNPTYLAMLAIQQVLEAAGNGIGPGASRSIDDKSFSGNKGTCDAHDGQHKKKKGCLNWVPDLNEAGFWRSAYSAAHGLASVGGAFHKGWKGQALDAEHGTNRLFRNPKEKVNQILSMPQFKNLTSDQKAQLAQQLEQMYSQGKIKPQQNQTQPNQTAQRPVQGQPPNTAAGNPRIRAGAGQAQPQRYQVANNLAQQGKTHTIGTSAYPEQNKKIAPTPQNVRPSVRADVRSALANMGFDDQQAAQMVQYALQQNPNLQQDLNGLLRASLATVNKATPAKESISRNRTKINKIQEDSTSTMKKTTVKESLLKLRAKKYIAEGEMQNAEAALAAKDLVDRLQDTVEEVSKMANEELPHLIDAIRGAFGDDKATAYQSAANDVLSSLLDEVKEKKSSLENATLVLTGDAQPEAAGAPGLELPDGEGEDLDIGDGEDDELAKGAADDLGADEKPAPLGRAVRPEATESRKNRKKQVTEAKKKSGKKPAWLEKKEVEAEEKEGKKVSKKEKKKVGVKENKKKNVAEAATRRVLENACPKCKAGSNQVCKTLKESKQFGGLHVERWQSVLRKKGK